jgi:hypothetical protein
MNKKSFESFLGKYNLGGACDKALYTVDDTTLSTRTISDDKNVLCEVSGPAMGLPAGSYGVYDTTRLRSLLNVLGDSLSVNVKKFADKVVGLTFDDTNTKVTFVLADAAVIPPVPELKTTPPFELTVVMDEQFINTFIRAKGALSEVDTFAIMSEGDTATAHIVLGHSALNTNRVRLTATATEAVKFNATSFSAKYLREILVANKGAGHGKLEVSSKGLARTSFVSGDITSTYYLVPIVTKE